MWIFLFTLTHSFPFIILMLQVGLYVKRLLAPDTRGQFVPGLSCTRAISPFPYFSPFLFYFAPNFSPNLPRVGREGKPASLPQHIPTEKHTSAGRFFGRLALPSIFPLQFGLACGSATGAGMVTFPPAFTVTDGEAISKTQQGGRAKHATPLPNSTLYTVSTGLVLDLPLYLRTPSHTVLVSQTT